MTVKCESHLLQPRSSAVGTLPLPSNASTDQRKQRVTAKAARVILKGKRKVVESQSEDSESEKGMSSCVYCYPN